LFYGDYCDTMKEFKPKFIRWAKELQALAEANNEFVMTYAVSCRPNRQLCLDQSAHEFPFVRLLKKNELVGRDLSYKDLTFSKAFRELGFDFKVEKDQNAWTMAGSLDTSPPPSRPIAQFSIDYLRHHGQSNSMSVVERRQALMDDVHLSLDFMLRNALFTEKKALSKERKRRFLKVSTGNGPVLQVPQSHALFQKFLRLMKRTLPAKWALQELLSVLLKDLEYITDRETYLLPILDRYPPRQKTWSPSCTKGKLGHAYSCGMWKLYHAMSVGLVRFNCKSSSIDVFEKMNLLMSRLYFRQRKQTKSDAIRQMRHRQRSWNSSRTMSGVLTAATTLCRVLIGVTTAGAIYYRMLPRGRLQTSLARGHNSRFGSRTGITESTRWY
jgi:hypothetical protein